MEDRSKTDFFRDLADVARALWPIALLAATLVALIVAESITDWGATR